MWLNREFKIAKIWQREKSKVAWVAKEMLKAMAFVIRKQNIFFLFEGHFLCLENVIICF